LSPRSDGLDSGDAAPVPGRPLRALAAHQDSPGPTVSVIVANGLTHHFGNEPALEGVDLVLDIGEHMAVLGDNGAGKTTLPRHRAAADRRPAADRRAGRLPRAPPPSPLPRLRRACSRPVPGAVRDRESPVLLRPAGRRPVPRRGGAGCSRAENGRSPALRPAF